MKQRVLTAVIGIAALALLLLFFDTPVFNLVFALVCVVAVHEIFNAFQFGKSHLYLFIGFIPFILLFMLSDYMSVRAWIWPAGYLFVLFLAVCVILSSQSLNFAKVSGMAVFSAIVVFCFYSLIHLKSLLPRAEYGYDAVYFLILILGYAWGGDTFAYLVGRALGKHKLAPKVSPNKTVEGAVGGVVGSMLVGLLISLAYITIWRDSQTWAGVSNIYYLWITLFGIPASILGMLGDLFASAVKRQCEIKDYGTIFPGHGGILDRFDSVMFVAPLVVIAVRVVFYFYLV
ncbi:phosphatidate cytidylyltransferase [Ruminococcaceae bacterium OttesenSCG-928-I18]|nr:phosphatidate cytidylyltransferase [Ruminococcaceae bacterium OttesenSCG-928-I18]